MIRLKVSYEDHYEIIDVSLETIEEALTKHFNAEKVEMVPTSGPTNDNPWDGIRIDE